ncbi:MAG: zinc-binding alcohol dehydrogenase family protein, partial [Myxococcaceae bacterium]|nr:zinc-binding alcohol dehydrogenase family protein [Myxococcaceae bacterium]
MKAVALKRYLPVTDPDCLLDVTLPDPRPSAHDLLVRVHAVSINPVDTKVRARGGTAEAEPRVLGWDAAGVVETVGEAVTRFNPGDAVYYAGSLTRPGCDSELHLVDERIVGPKPASLDFAQAAALPLTALTAYEALFERLGIDPGGADVGWTLLLINGAGGVGSIAIQLARLAGVRVIATASRPETQKWCKELGAEHVINHRQDLREQLKALGVSEVDCVFNTYSTEAYWDVMVDAVAPQGRIVSIVETHGPVDLGKLMRKSATFAWEFMFTRPMFQTSDMLEQHHILRRVAGWVDNKHLRTTLTERLSPISAATLRQAHAKVE